MNERRNLLVRHFGLRGVAIFEACKGLLALGIGVWALTLMHKDKEVMAARLLEFLHISPERSFSHLLLHAAHRLTDHNLWIFVFVIVMYVVVRLVEAGGLWLEKEWAEWFALLSGSLYLPWEIFELLRRPAPFKWGIFSFNVLLVIYLAWLLYDAHKHRAQAQAQTEAKE
ncbi:MAG TPA: DUF2127 domain-containing protein [Alphaproteobacteria bacterium]|nr:DUF2127 domain-containing protein [Alphaproteobacteria bacterium]